jgi:hypothetical protein
LIASISARSRRLRSRPSSLAFALISASRSNLRAIVPLSSSICSGFIFGLLHSMVVVLVVLDLDG